MVSKREQQRRERTVPAWYQTGMLTASGVGAYLLNLRLIASMGWKSSVFLIGVFAFRRFSGYPFGIFDWVLVSFLCLPLLLALRMTIGTDPEARLAGLAMRGRWDEVLSMIPGYRKNAIGALGTPRGTVATCLWKARAHQRLDHPEQVEESLEEIRETEGCTEADYLMVAAQIEQLAGEYERARDLAQQLIEIDPDRSEGWALVIELDAVYLHDAESARVALDEAMSRDWWAAFGPLTDYAVGVTLAAEGQHQQAIETLAGFRDFARQFAARSPMSWSLWSIAGCIQAEQNRATGQHPEAVALDAEIDELIRTHGFDELAHHADRFRNRLRAPAV